jgi:hypothetical protein
MNKTITGMFKIKNHLSYKNLQCATSISYSIFKVLSLKVITELNRDVNPTIQINSIPLCHFEKDNLGLSAPSVTLRKITWGYHPPLSL